MSDSSRPHELQHARPPCPSPTPRVHSNSRPWVGDAIQPSHPLLSPYPPPPTSPSIRVFSNEPTLCMRWPKYGGFHFSISPSSEHPGLIFKMDWLGRCKTYIFQIWLCTIHIQVQNKENLGTFLCGTKSKVVERGGTFLQQTSLGLSIRYVKARHHNKELLQEFKIWNFKENS